MGEQGGSYRPPGGRWGGRGGDSGRLVDRLFENPENPIGWSLRMFRFRGIDARIHLVTLIFLATEILWSLPRDHWGVLYMAGYMATLFVIVLLHEFGHCFACRAVGGESNRIVMLPFGGLAFTLPPHEWRAHLITTIGGPAVNVGLAVISSAALAAVGHSRSIVFNPFDLEASVPMQATSTGALVAITFLWQFHVVNIIILGFNVLMPFFPLDGGRIVQELLWARVGYRRSMQISTMVGLVGAGCIVVFGLATGQSMLMFIGLFGLWACWTERQRIRFVDDPGIGVTGLGVSGVDSGDVLRPVGPSKADLKRREREEAEAAEVDRILGKIATQGMQSLSRAERNTLERVRKKKSRTGPRATDAR